MRQCFSIATLTDYIGAAAARRLAEHHGGQTLKVPRRKTGRAFESLCRILGTDAAAVMVANFGGESLYVAMNQRELVEARRQDVLRRRAAGESFAHIARTMTFVTRFSERWVRRLAGENAPGALVHEVVPADKHAESAQTAPP